MSKFYKTLLLATIFTVGIADTAKLVAQGQVQTFTKRIVSGNDDVEENLATGALDFTSSDLEFTEDGGVNQIIAMRFTNVTIPVGAVITKAYIQFGVDELHSGTTNLTIQGEAANNSAAITNITGGISSRAKTGASVAWVPAAWPVANAEGPDQATPDLKTIVQEITGRAGWQSGNALTMLVTGSGRRNAHSYDGKASQAPLLRVEYAMPTVFQANIAASSDDAEERGTNASANAGTVDLTSSDLELSFDDATTGNQTIGLRFTNINLPKHDVITKAYIQFTQDEIKNEMIDNQAAFLLIQGQAADNAVTFAATANNISSRATTSSLALWNIIPAWTIQDEAGPNQRTPDLTNIVNEIRQRSDWRQGNAMSFILTGSGRRFAQAFDKSATASAKLVIEYASNPPAPGNFPVAKFSAWQYHDRGIDLGTTWKDVAFDASSWDYGQGVLGYGDPVTTTLSFGNNSSSKQPTSYLRHAFNASNVALYDTLVFKIRRDDGAVVYLNGVEQFRTNMPTGAITYNTWALATTDGANESIYFTFKVPSTQLVNGLNVLAVEMHQDRASSSDVTFDMEVAGQLKFIKPDTQVLALGSNWKYLANGTDQGTSWTAETFNDAAWQTGNAVLGYGNGDEATKIGFGSDATNKHITTYFRKTFSVTDTADFKALELQLIRDDAAVVYLNGTEVLRSNLMAGALNYQSTAVNFVEGADETKQVIAYINKLLLKQGSNTIAVEVHKYNKTETDLRFNLGLKLLLNARPLTPVTSIFACDPKSSDAIGCFTSVKPTAQVPTFVFPETHNFQLIAKSGTTQYTSGASGAIPGGNDFTGFVGKMGSSNEGYLSINHENSPGGVSMLKLHLDAMNMVWKVDSVEKVNFAPVMGTQTNCSGGVTPWGTVITSEETFGTGDANNDGYQDLGWQVEIDPETGKVIDHDGDGTPDKLWALGRMSHENVAVGSDSITVYQAEDGGSSGVYKFVATQKGNLSNGLLYVLQRDNATATTGTWILVPNTTQADRNNTRNIAQTLGATNWNGAEDIEFGPDGKLYFTSKGTGTIWRFQDNGMTVSGIEAWVTNTQYPITHSGGTQNESFGTGIDNLTFDGDGNLWALQDGGRGHLWVIRPNHTPANPKVELFATTPAGSESTGLTFTKDFKYGFLSFQHPNSSNTATQTDAAGNVLQMNAPTTIVFARKENLGKASLAPKFELGADVVICQGDSVQLKAFSGSDAVVKWTGNATDSVLTVSTSGVYYATAFANNGKSYTDSVRVTVAQMPVANLGADIAICGTSATTLDAGNAGMNYLWNTGATTKTISAATSGKYFVTITNPVGGCVASDSIQVTFNANPVVNLGTDITICASCNTTLDAGSGFASYLWSTGATTSTINVTNSGTYAVVVTDAKGCTATDTIVVKKVTGMMEEAMAIRSINVYPNPFQTETNIELNLVENTAVKVEVFDLAGKKIETLTAETLTAGKHGLKFRREEAAAKGIYLLHVTLNDKVAVRKLIKL